MYQCSPSIGRSELNILGRIGVVAPVLIVLMTSCSKQGVVLNEATVIPGRQTEISISPQADAVQTTFWSPVQTYEAFESPLTRGEIPASLPTPTLPPSTSMPILYSELAGLTYWNAEGLWQIQADGSTIRVFGDPFARPSQDSRFALYAQGWDIWIADLVSDERRNLTNTPDRYECCPRWWPARPEVILFGSSSSPVEDHFGPWYLTAVELSGEGYRVLDEEHSIFGGVSPSPDGVAIAYGDGWLYKWDEGIVERFDPGHFGVPALWVVGPAWSPDGKRLAWTVGMERDGELQTGTGIFSLDTMTGFALHFFKPVGFDGPMPTPMWNPKGEWLAIDAFADDLQAAGVWVFSLSGQPGDEFQLKPIAGVHANKSFTWSADGRWLAISPSPLPSRIVWIYEVGTWQMQEITLRSDGRVVSWREVGQD